MAVALVEGDDIPPHLLCKRLLSVRDHEPSLSAESRTMLTKIAVEISKLVTSVPPSTRQKQKGESVLERARRLKNGGRDPAHRGSKREDAKNGKLMARAAENLQLMKVWLVKQLLDVW